MEFYEVLRERRSIRSFTDEPIAPEVISRLVESVFLAPSGCNLQPYRFLFITEGELLGKLRTACRQRSVQEAPLLAVALVNRSGAWKMNATDDRSIGEIDLAIAVEHLSLAATAEGLGSCWIAAFDVRKVNEILQVREPYCADILLPIGHPGEEPRPFFRPVPRDELVKVVQ